MIHSDSLIINTLGRVYLRVASLPILLQLVLPLALTALSWVAYNFFLRHRGIPGPLYARLGIPYVLAWKAFKLDWVWHVERLHQQYGPVVRISPNQIDLVSSSAVQNIYSFSSKYQKPRHFYDGFVLFKGNPSIFSDTDPHSHAVRKRGISAAYSLNYLVKLEECVDPMVDLLIKSVRKKSRAGQVSQDMTKTLHLFAMDAVGELAFGKNFGLLNVMEDKGRFLRGASNLSQWGGAFAYLPSNCVGLLRKVMKRALDEPGPEVIGVHTKDRIDRRFGLLAQGKEPPRVDMLTKFIEAKNPDGTPYSPAQVIFTSSSIIAAGSDTTALAMAATLRYLVGTPRCYARAQAEIDEAFETGRLTEPCMYAQAVKLDYLQACVKEAMRLHPSIGMSLPRVVPPGGDIIDGRFYPAGTTVSVSAFILHRNTHIWGPDATEFRPERWIDGVNGEEGRKRLEKNFFTFGGGTRTCIGRNISLMEITKTLPRLLYHFDFTQSINTQGRIGRDSDGQMGTHIPWVCTSSWFLNAEYLWLDVNLRRPEEEPEDDD